MKTLRKFKLTLKLRGPVLVNSSAPSTFGVDAAVARDREGRVIVPGTLIKGKIREALVQLGEDAGLDDLLGVDSTPNSGDEPERGSLVIGDLAAQTNGVDNVNRHRVCLDHALGSAKGEMLRVIETPYLARQEVPFSGTAHCIADDGEAKEIGRKLKVGLCWLTQIGSLRTTGFGRVLDADVALEPATTVSASIQSAPAALSVALYPEGPLCISRHKIGDNLFESDEIIPGNMLAGAIMQVATELGIDKQLPDFHKIRFRHAFPTTGPDRPRALPLSIVKAGKIPYDITDFKEPVLLLDDQGKFSAPAFPLDWKRYDDVLTTLGWASPARELRVRTAINSQKRTADRGENGEGGKLFALEVVHHVTETGAAIAWRSQIDLSGVADPLATAKALVQVLGQLAYVSKTKVGCRVEWKEIEKHTPAPPLSDGDPLVLVLQTPALLADPRFQSVPGIARSGAISAKEMLALYRDAWADISCTSLSLEYHFAQQFLAGGNYLARRFQKNAPYDPWLLTKEGSVFVFTVNDATTATARLEAWFANGLTLPQWAIDRYGVDWRANPYRPENGFGEVAVHRRDFATPTTKPLRLTEAVLS